MLYQLQESVLRQIGGKCRISITATNTKLIDILIIFPHQCFKGFGISVLYAPYQNIIFYVHHLLSAVKYLTQYEQLNRQKGFKVSPINFTRINEKNRGASPNRPCPSPHAMCILVHLEIISQSIHHLPQSAGLPAVRRSIRSCTSGKNRDSCASS